MGLTDDPFYKNMIEGHDTKMMVGTLTIIISPPEGRRSETFPLFLIDYHGVTDDMEPIVAEALDDAKKVNLTVKDGTYSASIEERGTVLMFAEGETAAHTAPNFWAEYTPQQDEHEAFQREYARLEVWLLVIITKNMLREFVIRPDGTVIFKRVVPLTDDLRKMFGVE
jgi:hypothetical protein